MPNAVDIRDLVVRYGSSTAVNGLSLTAQLGKVTAIVGPNGAGKTSTIEVCEGLRQAHSGEVRVLDLNPDSDGNVLRTRVGVMLQNGGVPSSARPLEALRSVAAMHRTPLPVDELAHVLKLDTVTTTFRRMSGGEQQRLKLAMALVGRPELVFLDEPTAGLDPQAKHVVWDVIDRLRTAGVTILLTTHLMDDVERLANHVVVIADGRAVAAGTPAELTASTAPVLEFDAQPHLDLSDLSTRLDSATVTQSHPGHYVVTGKVDPAQIAAVTGWFAETGQSVSNLSSGQRRLEDVVVSLTRGGGTA